MSTPIQLTEEEKKNPFKVWLSTKDGRDCSLSGNFSTADSIKYLQNRLWFAYTAGQSMQLKVSAKQLQEAREEIVEISKELATTTDRLAGSLLEIERLKKVASNAFFAFRMRPFPHNEPTWEQFKTDNKL